MHPDHELRERTRRAVSGVQPDVERHLHQSIRRGRRRRVARRAAVTGAATVVAVSAVATWTLRPEAENTAVDRPNHSREEPALVGRYTTTLPASGAAQSAGMDGRWFVLFRTSGVLEMAPPAGFQGSVSGSSYEVSGSRFRTNAFPNDLCSNEPAGTYRWQLEGPELRFISIEDSCRVRAILLATQVWSETTQAQ